MYIYTYVYSKNCRQHSYGFQNLMSSWGVGNVNFEITIFTWVFKNVVPKVVFFLFIFNWIHHFFEKSQKPFLPCKLEKSWCHLLFVFYWINPVLYSNMYKFKAPPLIHTHPIFLHMILERIWIWCHVWGGSQNFLFSRGWGHKIWVLVGGFNCADWTVHFSDWATTMSLWGPGLSI